MKKLICIFLGITCHVMCFSQQKSNPTIYVEGILGYASGDSKGWTIGGSFNVQSKKDLFSFRILSVNEINPENDGLEVLAIIFPFLFTKNTVEEYAVLYGKRYIFDNKSLSLSIGASSVHREYKIRRDTNRLHLEENYFGMPFEVNILWFKSTKQRYRAVYGLVPIGKPTGFGRSIGFKLYGNISKHSFIGLGMTFGLGFYKKY